VEATSEVLKVGDKILIVAAGPHGCGLVEAEVWFVSSRPDPQLNASGQLAVFEAQDEGLTWTRGHDASTPEACALLTAAALGR
jgi:hypothetical protein